jgi:hypothetical protein
MDACAVSDQFAVRTENYSGTQDQNPYCGYSQKQSHIWMMRSEMGFEILGLSGVVRFAHKLLPLERAGSGQLLRDLLLSILKKFRDVRYSSGIHTPLLTSAVVGFVSTKWWDTRRKKPNDCVERIGVPLPTKSLNFKYFLS